MLVVLIVRKQIADEEHGGIKGEHNVVPGVVLGAFKHRQMPSRSVAFRDQVPLQGTLVLIAKVQTAERKCKSNS